MIFGGNIGVFSTLHYANTTFEGAVFMCTIQSTKAGLTPAQLLTERGPV